MALQSHHGGTRVPQWWHWSFTTVAQKDYIPYEKNFRGSEHRATRPANPKTMARQNKKYIEK